MIIGLTGHYCSGKTTLEKIIHQNYHFFIIDVDQIGHITLEEKKEQIISHFGSKILRGSSIDRKKLGQIVFHSKKKLQQLNSILHPCMREKIKILLDQNSHNNICISAALLFEMKLISFCDRIIIVKAPLLKILKRGQKRDRHSLIKIFRILCSQKLFHHISKIKDNSDDIYYINNNKDLNHLKIRLNRILTG